MELIQFPPAIPDLTERAKALDITASWITEAPAGSGKTGLLIQRFLKLLGSVNDPAEVLALTFTQKATAEMRERVLDALRAAHAGGPVQGEDFERLTRDLASQVLNRDKALGWGLLHRPYRLNIRTIDSLCSQIARAVPLLSGSGGVIRPVRDAGPLYQQAAHAVMMRFGGPDEALNEAVKTVLLHRDGDLPFCEKVLGEMLGTREQWGRLVPLTEAQLNDEVLDQVVLPRLNESLGRTLCAALTQLHRCFPQTELEQVAAIMRDLAYAEGHEGAESVFAPCATYAATPGTDAAHIDHWLLVAQLLLTKGGGTWRRGFVTKLVGAKVEKRLADQVKDLIFGIDTAELASMLHALRELPPANYPFDQWVVAKALFRLLHYALIELKLLFAREEVCDFAEISLAARTALESDAQEVQEALGTRLRHLLVDEMQDTSSSQYHLLQMLTAEWNGSDQTLFLVGDPKQSIYLFRQARVDLFQSCIVHERMGNVPLGVLRLSTNFRSGRHIVGEFNDAFTRIFPSDVIEAGDVTYAPAHAVKDRREEEGIAWHVEQLPFQSELPAARRQREGALRDEASEIGRLVHSWRQHRSGGSIAVLTRARSHIAEVTRVLAEAGIPYRAVEMDPLGERQEVLDVLAITRALLHPADRTAWLAILRAPWCGAGLGDLHTLAAGDDAGMRKQALRPWLRSRARHLDDSVRLRVLRTLDIFDAALANAGTRSLADQTERTWLSLGGDACTDGRGRENVRQYLRVLDEMEADGETADVFTLERRLKRLYAAPDASADAVDVMTIHKAKGLEWDLVLVPGMHRVSAAGGWPFLSWLELPTSAADGTPDVILAPLPPKGDDAETLNTFIRVSRKRLAAAELKRVFYVAATRARTSLHLFAWPESTSKGVIVDRKETLLKAAEKAVPTYGMKSAPAPSNEQETQSFALAASGDEPARNPRPKIQRLPDSFDPLLRLRSVTGTPRSDATAPPRRTFLRPDGSFGARAVGSAIHAFAERLTREVAVRLSTGLRVEEVAQSLLQELPDWSSAIRASLRSGGLPPNTLDRVERTVQRSLRNLLEVGDCRWLLLPHPSASSEASLRSVGDGGMVRVRLDRTFLAGSAPNVPGSDTLWIVDFKTSDHTTAGLEAFLEKERGTYEEQLRTYAEVLLRALPAGTPVMLALCYPLIGRLTYWPHQAALPKSEKAPEQPSGQQWSLF